MGYMQPMKNSLRLDITLCATLAIGALGLVACDKTDAKSGEAATTEVAAKTVDKAETTVAAVAPAAAATDEAACAGAEGKEHDGADCMKKSAESGEGMGCNKWDKEAAVISKQEIPADATWQVLKVDGMTCGGCERRIIATVGKLEGVVAVEADSELGQVRVAVASGNEKSGNAASAKISELGYKIQ